MFIAVKHVEGLLDGCVLADAGELFGEDVKSGGGDLILGIIIWWWWC